MNVQEFPQLFALASTGKIKTWKIRVYGNPDGTATTETKHGYVDGGLVDKLLAAMER